MGTRKGWIAFQAGLVLILIHCFSPAWAGSGLIEDLEAARMDWPNLTLTASGQADPSLPGTATARDEQQIYRRQAKLRARKALWQGLLQIRVHGEQTVDDILQARPQLTDKLRELVQTSPIEDIAPQHLTDDGRPQPDRPVDTPAYRARFSLSGKGAALCIPSELWYEHKDLAGPVGNGTQEGPPVTGLIVDARGLGGKPALVCRLFDTQGRLVFGPSVVSRQIGENQGMVVYRSSLPQARAHSRAGDSPLEVRARSRHAHSPTDFVIAAEDLQPLWFSNNWKLFRQGRVIIVLQEESGEQVVEYPLD